MKTSASAVPVSAKFSPVAISLACALFLGACASQPAAPGPASRATGLTSEAARITDERILGDRKTIDALQVRLRKLNDAGIGQNNYALAKAQCWVDTAKTQYHENDRTGYIEESLTEANGIIRALEASPKANAGVATPLVARSTLLRQDLWDKFSTFKGNPTTLACNAKTVACGEIALVRAGHAEQQTGWRQATPHVLMAEDALARAAKEALACTPQPAPAVAAVVAAVVTPPPVVVADAPAAPKVAPRVPATLRIERETFDLRSDALFRFDRGSVDQIISGGPERINEIARRLRDYRSIDSIVVIGHTDRFGSDAYNDALSAKRAQTVAELLTKAGVTAASLRAEGRGKREPLATQCPATLPRAKAIDCLQADRRVTIEVRGIIK